MALVRFREECPGISATIERILGNEAAQVIASDYAAVADAGGNREGGVKRVEGVSFNPRIARILSIVLLDGGVREVRALRVAIYSTLFPHSKASHMIPLELSQDVRAVEGADSSSPEWMQVIALSLMLDTVRHRHMLAPGSSERLTVLDPVASHPLLTSLSARSSTLRAKVLHALNLQERRQYGGSER